MELAPYLTSIMAILGMVVGTLISPKINQRVNTLYNRKDFLFKKKFEYFEKIAETLEDNKRMYQKIIGKVESSKKEKDIQKIITELKNERRNFLIKSSPLYFDTRGFSEKIIDFVRIEKNIFQNIEQLKKEKTKRDEILEQLKGNVKRLKSKGNEVLYEMKKELFRN